MTVVLYYDFVLHPPFSPWVFDKSWHWNIGVLKNDAHIEWDKLVLDGKDDYVKVSDAPTSGASEVTFKARIYPVEWVSSGLQYIASVVGPDTLNFWFGNYNGKLALALVTADASIKEIIGTIPSTGKWHTVSWAYDGSEAKIYVDGELKATNTTVGGDIPSTSSPLGIGARTGKWDRNFNGKIDEIRIKI